MFFLGIIGEYLGRLFIQSKHRPLYVMREIRRHQTVTDAVASGDVETTARIIPEAQPEVEVPQNAGRSDNRVDRGTTDNVGEVHLRLGG
jgi:hypothetical protein